MDLYTKWRKLLKPENQDKTCPEPPESIKKSEQDKWQHKSQEYQQRRKKKKQSKDDAKSSSAPATSSIIPTSTKQQIAVTNEKLGLSIKEQ
eukprot:14001386-Ditylum_brightwellii.AAC.1